MMAIVISRKRSYGDYNGDGDIVGYAETVGVSFYGYSLINPTWTGCRLFCDGPINLVCASWGL